MKYTEHSILDSISIPAVILDNEGVISAVNSAGEEYLSGLENGSINHFAGSSFFDILKSNSVTDTKKTDSILAGIREVIEKRRTSFSMEYETKIKSRSGWTRMTAKRITQDDESAISIIFEDITDRKQLEKECDSLQKTAANAKVQARKSIQFADKTAQMAATGVMLTSLIHEVNQPLNAITINSDSILFWNRKNQGILPDVIIELVTDISAGARQIDEILKQMRSYWNTTGEESLENADFNQVVAEALELTQRKVFSHGIKFKTELYPGEMPIRINRHMVELIIANLIADSIKTLDGHQSTEKKIVLRTVKTDDRAQFDIWNNGHLFIPKGDVNRTKDDEPHVELMIARVLLEKFNGETRRISSSDGGIQTVATLPLSPPSGMDS